MQELQKVVSTAFANIVASGAIEKAIEAKLQKTITEAIDDELRSYSDFGKIISERIKQSLQVNFDSAAIPGYNDLILKIIAQQLNASMSSALTANLQERMTELLAPAPAEMKLSALVKDFVEISMGRYDADSLDDEFTMIVERDKSISSMRFERVYFDRKPHQESHRCAYHLRLVDGVVSNIRFDGTDPGKALFVGHLYGFERRLFQLYAAGTSLILDDQEQEISTYYRSSDY